MQIGLRLVVPALTLAVPAALLIWGLLALPVAAPEAGGPVPPELVVAVLDAEPDTAAEAAPTDLAPTELAPAAPSGDALAALATSTPPSTPQPTPQPTPPPTLRSTPAATATPREVWGGPPTFTFVALGVDQRDDREIPRTDTIMIGRVDLRAPRVTLVSIPRDLLVDIPGYGKDRINTAYVYGEQFKEPGGGIGLLERTIEQSFGVRIDHFGLVDFQCFRTAVDAVGGVTINVPKAIVDPNYPTEDYGTKLIRFEPGVQRMDGERALEYARTRYADSDFHRIQRQQLIVAAMREQLLHLRTLPALPTVVGGCRNMRSDLGWREYLSLAATLKSLDSTRVSFAAIDEGMTIDANSFGGAAVLLPRWEPIRALIAESFGSGSVSPGNRAGVPGSPTPARPLDSPAPAPSASPFPRDASVAGPLAPEFLPGDAPPPRPPSAPPAGRS
jgi:LCP family protein required for cell wall assembly